MTQSDANKRIQQNAAAFLAATSRIERPAEGLVAEFLDGKPTTGLNPAMRALAEAIGQFQDIAMGSPTEDLLDRLRELCENKPRDKGMNEIANPYNPLDNIIAVAYPGEDGPSAAEIQKLRDAFKDRGEPIFDRILALLTDIAVNKRMELEDGMDDIVGEDRPDKPKKIPPMGWRQSVGDERYEAIDDEKIKDSARDHDRARPPADEKAIRESAAGGDEFEISGEHRTEYEKAEGRDDGKRLGQIHDEKEELRAYYRLCKTLKKAYDDTLGTCLEQAGASPGKPK